MEYKLIRSGRRTLSLEVRADGVIVRAPYAATEERIRAFVRDKQPWIERHLARVRQQTASAAAAGALTDAELRALTERAKVVFPARAAHYAPLVGVTYGRITIRHQHTRWGSCSPEGNLSFNCLLLLAPPEVLDSVVAHELCHRKEMNHSPRFYAELLRVFPTYRQCRRWLTDHGRELLARLPGEP